MHSTVRTSYPQSIASQTHLLSLLDLLHSHRRLRHRCHLRQPSGSSCSTATDQCEVSSRQTDCRRPHESDASCDYRCDGPIVNLFAYSSKNCANSAGNSPFAYQFKFSAVPGDDDADRYQSTCQQIKILNGNAASIRYTGDGAYQDECVLEFYNAKNCKGGVIYEQDINDDLSDCINQGVKWAKLVCNQAVCTCLLSDKTKLDSTLTSPLRNRPRLLTKRTAMLLLPLRTQAPLKVRNGADARHTEGLLHLLLAGSGCCVDRVDLRLLVPPSV